MLTSNHHDLRPWSRLATSAVAFKIRFLSVATARARRRKSARNQSNVTYRIPQEILASCFVFLGIEDVVRASHVCHAWRSTALAFPMVWSNIRLDSGVLLFENNRPRLHKLLSIALIRARHHPVDLEFRSHLPPSIITPILYDHMHHLRTLCWTNRPLCFELVKKTAPILENLCCDSLCPIPTDLFGGSAPKLRIFEVPLRLCLPESCPALSNVTSLIAPGASENDQEAAQSFRLIFLLMPRLVYLKLYRLVQVTCDYLPKGPAPETLERVALLTDPFDFAFMAGAPLACDVVAPVVEWTSPCHNFMHIELQMSLDASKSAHMSLLFEDAVSLYVEMATPSFRLVATTLHGHTRDFTFVRLDVDPASVQREIVELLHRHIPHLHRIHSLRAPAVILSDELLRAMPALADLTAVLPKWETAYGATIEGEGHTVQESHFSCAGLSFLRYIANPALAKISVHIDVKYRFSRGVEATRDDAEAVISAIASFLRCRDPIQPEETLELAVTGFPRALVQELELPTIAGYAICFGETNA